MMRHKKSMPGFTLLEVIIAMILSAILILVIFNLLHIIRKEWQRYSNAQNTVTQTLLFKKVLDHDMERASHILKQSKHELSFISSTDTIDYHFSRQVVRTVDQQADTFAIVLSGYQAITLESVLEAGIVKEIYLDIEKPIEMKQVSFHKFYTSADLMNLFY